MTIRKELFLLIQEKQKTCLTDKEKNHAVNLARQEINEKYGYSWRDQEAFTYMKKSKKKFKSYRNPEHIGTDIPEGDEWQDYAQTADDF
jgi:hypothetical protein